MSYVDEIVVVNNGSTDATGRVIEEYKSRDARIVAFTIEKNIGLGHGFRLGVSKSTGDIVARQDADLEYDPNELINLVEQIANGNADVVYGSRMLVRKAHKVHYYYSYLANILITHFCKPFYEPFSFRCRDGVEGISWQGDPLAETLIEGIRDRERSYSQIAAYGLHILRSADFLLRTEVFGR